MTNPYDNRPDDQSFDPSFGGNHPGPAGYPSFPGANDPAQGFLVSPEPGAGKRLGAFLIDFIVFGIVAGILVSVLAAGDMMDYANDLVAWDEAGQTGPSPELAMGRFYLGAVISMVLWFVYRVLMEVKVGRTLGKMALGIRVVGDDGQKLTSQQSFIRNSWFLAIAVVGNVPFIGTFLALGLYAAIGVTIARDPQNQHPCDKWARAHVVNAR
ncbi:RDD family protein [Corynebacterium sp.]|uniref:RDD family protein n=1 Tax=Corynebacterium sp. TaxID=1720 RepID=UPI003B3B3121